MRDWFSAYGKSIALFAGALVIVVKTVIPDGIDGSAEWLLLGSAVVGGIATYIAPNLAGGVARYTKAITYGAAIVIAALPALLPGGITGNEWLDLVVLVATEFGVIILPAPQHPASSPAVAA